MKVLVTNIPVRSYATKWVTVPDNTSPDAMSQAIAETLLNGEVALTNADVQRDGIELDEGAVRSGWQFNADEVKP
jgi:hypothetical protein